MKILYVVALLTLVLVHDVSAGFRGGFRGSSFRGLSTYKSSSYYKYPHWLLPAAAVILLLNSNSQVQIKALKDNDLLDLNTLIKVKSKEECDVKSEKGEYAVVFRKEKSWCYVYNRL